MTSPTSPIELTTRRTEAPQARRPCANSLETFTQSFSIVRSRRLAVWRGAVGLPTSSAGLQFACSTCEAAWACNLFIIRVKCVGCCHGQRPPPSFHRLLAQAMSHSRRPKSSIALPGRPCTLYATIFHTVTKDRVAGERMRNGQD